MRAGLLILPAALAAVAIGVTGWAALAPISSGSREQVYVIPQGTWARRAAGEEVENVPPEIRLTLGIKDILVLRNRDDVPQMVGPVLIMPGQSFELPFRIPSVYIFTCSLHASGRLSVVVEPSPEHWWARLRWRAAAIVRPGGPSHRHA
jgi:hypothetical protein